MLVTILTMGISGTVGSYICTDSAMYGVINYVTLNGPRLQHKPQLLGRAGPPLGAFRGLRPGLQFIKAQAPLSRARAGAFRPSWAGTALSNG